jgi:hypothetical protein
MNPIQIIDNEGTIIAAHTIEHPRSSYGTQIWCIYDESPSPGPAVLKSEGISCPIEIIDVIGGWLVCKRSDGLLFGVIWSDGSYFADLLTDESGEPVKEYRDGLQVRGTVPLGELGSVLI